MAYMDEEVDPIRTLAEAIDSLSEGVQNIEKMGVKRKAIVVLLSHSTGLCQRDVRTVLNSLADMKNEWLINV